MINLTIKACFVSKTWHFLYIIIKKKSINTYFFFFNLSTLFKTQVLVLSLICSFLHTEAKDLNRVWLLPEAAVMPPMTEVRSSVQDLRTRLQTNCSTEYSAVLQNHRGGNRPFKSYHWKPVSMDANQKRLEWRSVFTLIPSFQRQYL